MTIEKSHIVDGLLRLGLRPTSRVMVHGSLSRFGQVSGGAETLIAALREAAGPEGAVIAPSFRDAYRSDYYALRGCSSVCPQDLCPSRERGYTGVIGETLRQQAGAVRSCHPTHSWAAIGGDAASLLRDHRKSLTPCGDGSPFFELMERDGAVLLLGVGINSFTNMHAVEDARNVPYLSAIDPPHRHATYTTSGRRIQYRYPELLQSAMQECGLIRSTQIGQAQCLAMSARACGSFLWIITADDPWCLVLRPFAERYDPQADAEAKCAAMVRAWKRNPDAGAWRKLVEESARPKIPILFQPAAAPKTACPAYRGIARDHHRCAANDLPPWEQFAEYPPDEPGVATCQHCNWGAPAAPEMNR